MPFGWTTGLLIRRGTIYFRTISVQIQRRHGLPVNRQTAATPSHLLLFEPSRSFDLRSLELTLEIWVLIHERLETLTAYALPS